MKINAGIPEEYHDQIISAAVKSNLHDIEDWNSQYTLTKISGKNNKIIPPGQVGKGILTLIGSGERVGLYLLSRDEWFRTSAVLKCNKNDEGYEIVTENSIYQLTKV